MLTGVGNTLVADDRIIMHFEEFSMPGTPISAVTYGSFANSSAPEPTSFVLFLVGAMLAAGSKLIFFGLKRG